MYAKGIVLKIVLYVCGLLLLVSGVVFALILPDIFDDLMAKEMQLTPTSRSYDNWKRPPIDLSIDIYVFNWTNAGDFKNGSIKPHFEQLGPYRFIDQPDKVDIKFNPGNSTVTYRRLSLFHFDAINSNGSLNDIVTTVNVVALSAAEKARFANILKAKSISIGLAMYGQQIHVTVPIRELLFEGYEDRMVSLAKDIPFLAGEQIPFDRVGWFYNRNNSADLTGWYNVHTGVDDIDQIGSLKNWNFRDMNGAFDGDCGRIDGSAGEFFAPRQTRGKISIFSPDMCRSIPLDYEQDVDVHGLLGYKFAGSQRSIDNGSMYPENWCYSPGEISYSGVLNISSCRFGIPVFMSYPHFYGADPYYIKQIDGLVPHEKDHQFYVTLEPSTGIALDVAARLQINLLINPNPNVGIYADAPKHFMPILWFEQRVTMPQAVAADIKMAINSPWIGQLCSVIVVIVGLMLMLPLVRFLCKEVNVNEGEKIVVSGTMSVEEFDKLIEQNGFVKKPVTDLINSYSWK